MISNRWEYIDDDKWVDEIIIIQIIYGNYYYIIMDDEG